MENQIKNQMKTLQPTVSPIRAIPGYDVYEATAALLSVRLPMIGSILAITSWL
ncbi:putative sodium:neurotransmitter symporter [Rosellinia necatrix]|uniref:Putative sodium:neurotransmitter symporter n=1 Tax=Rosellinia necatrix TaxID=77044 RepID=A0A1S8A8Y4_ROSNE|nr:putative sodium:neurotransmitter symporter [Rosellinia necatrix]